MCQAKKGLILAGGGARGSYQVGVWQALCELGWHPDIITGTSVGSFNAAMFVLDAADTARAMWLSIRSEDVITLPEGEDPFAELHIFLREIVRSGGLDITPLERIIDRVLDEDALRAAPIQLGLVTVARKGLRRVQLTLPEIPYGQVKDYLLASAAFFPAIRPREIDGSTYLDGAYQDLMPHQLAIAMGATELVCVDIDGMGITRKNPLADNTVLVESHWDLGDLLVFDHSKAAQNIALGYYDTLRAFGKLRGTAYGIQPPDTAREIAWFRIRYDTLLLQSAKHNPTLALTELTALKLFAAKDKDLAPLELAAKTVGVPPCELYTVQSLIDAFLQHYPPDALQKFTPLWQSTHPAMATRAGIKPNEFIAALVYAALTQNPLAEEVFTDDRI